MMKERPILFSGEMVSAILNGNKTQTRRIVKPQPQYIFGEGKRSKFSWRDGSYALFMYPENSTILLYCPYGKPGDKLWVRETFNRTNPEGDDGIYFYRSTDSDKYRDAVWKPSIFMPRKASRILLEVVSVRIERLNDIGEEDSFDEGMISFCGPTYRDAYIGVWESINGHGSWQENPFVWVIKFKVV